MTKPEAIETLRGVLHGAPQDRVIAETTILAVFHQQYGKEAVRRFALALGVTCKDPDSICIECALEGLHRGMMELGAAWVPLESEHAPSGTVH